MFKTWVRRQKPSSRSRSAFQSDYDGMLLEMEHRIPLYYFAAAGFFSWLLLAGYLVSPSTYASMQQSDVFDDAADVAKSLFRVVRNVPALYIASSFCLVAAAGLGYLSYKWWHNPLWIRRNVVLPTLTNSVMGLVSTFVNVYGMQDGTWSITAVITGAIIGGWFALFLAWFLYIELIQIPPLR